VQEGQSNTSGSNVKKRRDSLNIADMIRPLHKKLKTANRWIKKQRKGRFSESTLLSLVTRPLWLHDQIKAWMGAPLMAAVMIGATVSAMPSTDGLIEWDITQPVSEIPGYSTQIQTDHTYLLPVTNLTGISQTFRPGHPGIDFRAPLGSDVISMDDGVVTAIIEQKQGYGRHVYVTDVDGKVALYAHLGLIMVEVGDSVNAGVKIGEIGMTGMTTGPHLHFEVAENGQKINPLALVSKSIKPTGR
jgi:murein DD-endopeptidase MepM/ murein hydrolase activator NlpD